MDYEFSTSAYLPPVVKFIPMTKKLLKKNNFWFFCFAFTIPFITKIPLNLIKKFKQRFVLQFLTYISPKA